MLNFYAKRHADFENLIEKRIGINLIDSINHKLLNYETITQAATEIGEEI